MKALKAVITMTRKAGTEIKIKNPAKLNQLKKIKLINLKAFYNTNTKNKNIKNLNKRITTTINIFSIIIYFNFFILLIPASNFH